MDSVTHVDHKKIKKSLADFLIKALENKEISLETVQEISGAVLDDLGDNMPGMEIGKAWEQFCVRFPEVKDIVQAEMNVSDLEKSNGFI